MQLAAAVIPQLGEAALCTKTTAQRFLDRLKDSGATKLIDVRLNNVSQLAGFAKRGDLND